MRKNIIGVLVMCLLVFAVSPGAIAADRVRIGALFPFSGPLALLGQETFNGATYVIG